MTMYGIRDRSPFVQYNTNLNPTKQQSNIFSAGTRRYYSSTDAEIYFGSYYVDEIVQIAYSVSQNNMPLFGYNSYVFDEMAIGSRIVSGQFTINFTRPGYLFELLAALDKETSISETENVSTDDSGLNEEENIVIGREDSNRFTSTNYSSISRDKRPIWFTGFDIDIMFGEETAHSPARHVMLEGVYINASQLNLDTSGQPVSETYTFIARDIRPIDSI